MTAGPVMTMVAPWPLLIVMPTSVIEIIAPVADLSSPAVQAYTDGQLHWIIENGINPSGMPAWKGILEEDEMWKIVRYIRHLPPKGSLGTPEIFKEEEDR